MACTLTNRGLYTLLNSAITGSTDIRQLVIKGTVPSTTAIRAMNTVADLLAVATEAAASGYARADLASVTITEVDGSNQVTLTAAAPVYSTPASGETWTAVGYYIEGASDSARALLAVDEPSSTIATNGSNVTAPALSITVSQG